MAQASIQYTCRLLRSYGVNNVTPELIRQAKFNASAVYQPLLKALHDLALCVAAGLPRGCGEGLSVLNQQLQHELVDAQTTTPEGRVLLLHLLSQWGCPSGLVAELAMGCLIPAGSDKFGSSRICLLALAWLIGHAQLFERALQHLQLPSHMLHLLPPYPEDTSFTPGAQAALTEAVTAAKHHACQVQQLLSSQSPAADGSCWPAVQAAAQHLLTSYHAACLRHQQLTALLAGREKLLHDVQEQQQQQQHSVPGSQRSSSSNSLQQPIAATAAAGAGRQRKPLTAFELHLLSNPALLQQHEQAVHKACSLLQQQLQCIQAAQTFFAWAGSVLQEEQKAAAAAAALPCPTSVSSSSSSNASKAHCRQQHAMSDTPSVADVLPLLQQLPDVTTPAAAQVLGRVVKQLRQLVVDAAAAGINGNPSHVAIATGHDSSYSYGNTGSSTSGSIGRSMGTQQAAANVDEQLAKLSVTADAAANVDVDSAAAEQLLQPYWQTAASAMLQGGFVLGCTEQLGSLPSDLQEQLQQLQEVAGSKQLEEQKWQQPGRAWHRLCLGSEQMSALHARFRYQQQQQQQQQHVSQGQQLCAAAEGRTSDFAAAAKSVSNLGHVDGDVASALSLADALLQDVGGREGEVELVPVAAELNRLQELSINVAKQLAEKRAANKQQLQALQDAILCAAGPEQLMILK